ncbi:MAG TPA: 50S ribosomal protein L11 methyltransferase [Longimicrobiales bacterium]|nr:50S ribosomal protein L11 methyltransferase [Longimicrobiales bacterium]
MTRTAAAARWFVLSALVPPPGEEFLMVDGLRRLGARAVERAGERVMAWLPAPDDVAATLRDAEAVLRTCTSMTDAALAWRWQSHAEWRARWVQDVAPRRVTDRIVVVPTGCGGDGDVDDVSADRDRGDVVIRVEAGIAFGTAEHATTRGCLRLLERVLRADDCVVNRAVDIGTGSGVLAIAAALLGARAVLALEADALSCESARRNAAANGVADRVRVRGLMVGPAELRRLPHCDLILANLEAGLLRRLLPAVRDRLAPRGTLIVSGVTTGERAALLDAAAAAGLKVAAQDDVDGWLSVAFATSPAT